MGTAEGRTQTLCFLTYLVANDLRWEYGSIAFGKQKTQGIKLSLKAGSGFTANSLQERERWNKNMLDPYQPLEFLANYGRDAFLNWLSKRDSWQRQNLSIRKSSQNGVAYLKIYTLAKTVLDCQKERC